MYIKLYSGCKYFVLFSLEMVWNGLWIFNNVKGMGWLELLNLSDSKTKHLNCNIEKVFLKIICSDVFYNINLANQ